MVTPEPEIQVEEPKAAVKVIKGKIKPPKPIIFGSNNAQTTPEGESLLRDVADFLKNNPNMKVRIEGYTDNMGDQSFNQAVSEYRAIWVKLLLTNMGIPEGRLEVRGFGSSKPLASNKTEAGRIKNRRVEFTVLTQ
jgi:outer membrane protein OmpA-like peptidoglycan-associated protein